PELVVLSSAMHSLIPLDADGHALMNMMTWADGRSAGVAAELRASEYAEVIYTRTGTPVHAMSPLCKIGWLRKNKPDLFGSTTRFISIKEYIWWQLFGTYEVDYSIASATGLFDINDLDWYAPSLAFAGIRASQLSTPVNTNHQRRGLDANLAAQLSIDSDTPFMIGASDGCLAHLGSHAFKPGAASLTIGSSGAVRVSRTKPAVNFGSMTFNYRLDENTFVCGGPINNGGLVLRWFLGDILGDGPPDNDTFLAKVTATTNIAPGAEGLIFLPYILGERAPIWNSHARAFFFGLHLPPQAGSHGARGNGGHRARVIQRGCHY
ncbi:MAG: gluconokinase, partial [Bacteroidia bacterium]|nr:gluconokinase [Bacteroidia bacterium]